MVTMVVRDYVLLTLIRLLQLDSLQDSGRAGANYAEMAYQLLNLKNKVNEIFPQTTMVTL